MLVYLITAIHIFVCMFIIIVVLLQSGKAGDIASVFGGAGTQAAFGPRGTANILEKATTWSAVLFMITSITLSIVATRHTGSGSVLQSVRQQKPAATQPVAPARPANPTPAPVQSK
jgi:preprotein translocase subunit SecG